MLEKELEKEKTNNVSNPPVVLWKRACALCSKGLRIEYGNEKPYPSFRTCCGVYVCHACATDASSGETCALCGARHPKGSPAFLKELRHLAEKKRHPDAAFELVEAGVARFSVALRGLDESHRFVRKRRSRTVLDASARVGGGVPPRRPRPREGPQEGRAALRVGRRLRARRVHDLGRDRVHGGLRRPAESHARAAERSPRRGPGQRVGQVGARELVPAGGPSERGPRALRVARGVRFRDARDPGTASTPAGRARTWATAWRCTTSASSTRTARRGTARGACASTARRPGACSNGPWPWA